MPKVQRRQMQKLSGAYTLSHPIRASIVKLLRQNEEMYVSKVAKELGISERLAAFHFSMLSSAGFVTSQYRLANPGSPPRVVRYYRLTSKVDQTLKDFIEVMK